MRMEMKKLFIPIIDNCQMIELIVHFAEREAIVVENTRVSNAEASEVLFSATSPHRATNAESRSTKVVLH